MMSTVNTQSTILVFRVDYSDSEDLGKLCEAVNNKALGSVDRLNILDDLFRLNFFINDPLVLHCFLFPV